MKETPYADIPARPRYYLDETYTPRGVEIVWASRNRMLDDQAPRDLWEIDPEAVVAWAQSLTGGQVAT